MSKEVCFFSAKIELWLLDFSVIVLNKNKTKPNANANACFVILQQIPNTENLNSYHLSLALLGSC